MSQHDRRESGDPVVCFAKEKMVEQLAAICYVRERGKETEVCRQRWRSLLAT